MQCPIIYCPYILGNPKWESEAESKHAGRWIIFIAYLLGLSVGVHLLNLLAIVFIYYFKNYEFSRQGFIKAFLIAILLTGGIQAIIIPGIAAWQENLTFLCKYNWSTIPLWNHHIFCFDDCRNCLWTKLLQENNKHVWATIMSFTVLLIGYSTFFALVIRSNANTPIDENNLKL